MTTVTHFDKKSAQISEYYRAVEGTDLRILLRAQISEYHRGVDSRIHRISEYYRGFDSRA